MSHPRAENAVHEARSRRESCGDALWSLSSSSASLAVQTGTVWFLPVRPPVGPLLLEWSEEEDDGFENGEGDPELRVE